MNKLVTLDQAMKLKKFRFDLLTEFQYHNTELVKLRKRNEDDEFYISAPTVDDALQWLRENKGIMCAVELEPIIEHFRITGCEYKGSYIDFEGKISLPSHPNHLLATSALLDAVLICISENKIKTFKICIK